MFKDRMGRGIFMKIITIILLMFNILHADIAEEVRLKVERALACNASITAVSDVQLSTIEKSTQYPGAYYVEGIYKSVVSINKKIMGFGVDGFNSGSGSFEGLVGKDLKIKKIYWKLGLARGQVKSSCLLTHQRRF